MKETIIQGVKLTSPLSTKEFIRFNTENPELKLRAIDERFYTGFRGVLIQNVENSEIRIVKLTKENEPKFNRNNEKDLITLWKLYEIDEQFRII